MLKNILTERVSTLLFYKDLLIIITFFVVYLWDDRENLMIPGYLKIPPLSGVSKKNVFIENPVYTYAKYFYSIIDIVRCS